MTEKEPELASPCTERTGQKYDHAQLLSILKQDEAARKYLRYVLACTCGKQINGMQQREIAASAVRKLESCGIFRLVDHRHLIENGITISELELLLAQAVNGRILAIPERHIAPHDEYEPSFEVKAEWQATWDAVRAANRAVEYFASFINPKVVGLEHAKRALLLALVSAGDVYGDRGRKS